MLLATGIVFFPGIVIVVHGPTQTQQSNSFIFVGLMMLLVWVLTRRKVVRVTSIGSGKMNIDVNNLSKEEVETFIDDIQLAQANRLRMLQSR